MTTEQHTPQVSKRDEALKGLTNYFSGFIVGCTGQGHVDDLGIVKQANRCAIDVYRIVKRAEGFDV